MKWAKMFSHISGKTFHSRQNSNIRHLKTKSKQALKQREHKLM